MQVSLPKNKRKTHAVNLHYYSEKLKWELVEPASAQRQGRVANSGSSGSWSDWSLYWSQASLLPECVHHAEWRPCMYMDISTYILLVEACCMLYICICKPTYTYGIHHQWVRQTAQHAYIPVPALSLLVASCCQVGGNTETTGFNCCCARSRARRLHHPPNHPCMSAGAVCMHFFVVTISA
jgi:hypothetical protein